MNWSAVDFDWSQVRAFLATAEEGSLSAAARVLGLAQPTLGRQVAALEASLGVALFERAGRGLILTPTGRDLLDHARAMAEAATRLSLVAAGRSEVVAGRVSISVSDMIAVYVMPEILAQLNARAPEIEVELIVTNSVSDLLRREADIALRHVRPEEPELVTRLLRRDKGQFYASAAFIRRYGHPRSLQDAADLPFIGMGPPDAMAAELKARGIDLSPSNFTMWSAALAVSWEMARQGLGIGITTANIARRFPEMVQVIEEAPEILVDLWLTTHRELRTSARIRVVYDFLATALAKTA